MKMKQTKGVARLLHSVDRERESPPTAVGAATSASRAGRNLSEEETTLLLLLLLPPSSFLSSSSSHQKISIVTIHRRDITKRKRQTCDESFCFFPQQKRRQSFRVCLRPKKKRGNTQFVGKKRKQNPPKEKTNSRDRDDRETLTLLCAC